jgi:hypothetical protein
VIPAAEVRNLVARYGGKTVGGMQTGGVYQDYTRQDRINAMKAGATFNPSKQEQIGAATYGSPTAVKTPTASETSKAATYGSPTAVRTPSRSEVIGSYAAGAVPRTPSRTEVAGAYKAGAPTPTPALPGKPGGAYEDAWAKQVGETDAQKYARISARKAPAPAPTGEPSAAEQYTTTGMDALQDIVTGEHPYYESSWNRAIGDQAGAGAARTAGLKQELAMGGLSADQMTTAMASRSRDVEAERGKLYGDLAVAAGKMSMDAAGQLAGFGQTQQNIDFAKEKYADSEGWTAFNAAMESGDFSGAAEKFKEITGQDMDVSKLEEQYNWKKQDRAVSEATVSFKAGDYKGMNKILTDAGMDPIDTSKLEAGEKREVIADIDNILAGLGPDADPRLLAFYGAIKANIVGSIADDFNVDTNNMTVVDPETGEEMTAEDILTAVDDPDNASPEVKYAALKLQGNAQIWWDESQAASTLRSQLTITSEGSALLDGVENGDEASITELGHLVGAAATQDWENPLSGPQIEILKKYGLFDEEGEAEKARSERIAARGAVTEQFDSGNFDYDALDEKTRATIDDKTFTEMATKYVVEKVGSGGLIDERGGLLLSDKEYDLLGKSGDSRFVGSYDALSNVSRLFRYDTGKGRNEYVLKDEAKLWFASNQGKIVTVNGNQYIPISMDKAVRDGKKRPGITFVEVATGQRLSVSTKSDFGSGTPQTLEPITTHPEEDPNAIEIPK